MEQVQETMSELDDLMNDNLSSNDGFVEHDKIACHIGAMDSNEAMDIDENDVVGKLIEDSGKDTRNEYNITSKEINDSVMSDNDMFEDSFDKDHTGQDNVGSVLKSFECTTEGKNASLDLNEIESASSEEKSNQHCIFDLLQCSNKESLSIDDGNILANATSALSVGAENIDSQSTTDSSHIQISSTAEVINFPNKDKLDSKNQDLTDECLMSHGNTHDGMSNNGNNVIEILENDESVGNGINKTSSNKLSKISNGHSELDTENLNKLEKINESEMHDDLNEKNDSSKNSFNTKTTLFESKNSLAEDEDTEMSVINSHLHQPPKNNRPITIIDENMEIGLHDKYNNDQLNGNIQAENGSTKSIDNCISENLKENIEFVDRNEKVESDNNMEQLDKSETYKDLADSLLQSNSDSGNKLSNSNSVSLSENLLACETNTANSLSDFHYPNSMAPNPASNDISSSLDTGLILDPTYDSPQSSRPNSVDKVVLPPKGSCLRISPRSLLNNSVKSSISHSVKKLKVVDSVRLKTCHVNLKKVRVGDNYSPLKSKPNLTKLKVKLEDMLYESTKQEEIGIKEIKKMRQERSRAYGNLLKELTRVKNKIKNVK